tara:strand:- start:10083 stop:10361 length:279 start_codon:yes stop_codon:yes gene_type:complete
MKKIITTLFIINIFCINPSFAWTGYEKDSTNIIDIGSGSLTRIGLIISFFDFVDNKSHDAEILSMENNGNFLEITLFDIDLQKERIFLMEND